MTGVDALVVDPSVKNFQEDQLNSSSFPIFPGVVDTLIKIDNGLIFVVPAYPGCPGK